ncbi:methyl-accepting chemotaxis protein [Sporomusaceae bacterium BoRhaA]|nr:methyl-accepting chemotaxis protein [Pelorhabdus rhamnosifermentans]
MQRIIDLLKTVKLKDTGYASIVDKSGMIIAHSKMPELNGKFNIVENKTDPELKNKISEVDKNFSQLFKVASNGKQVIGSYNDIDGVKHVGVFTLLRISDNQQWVMIVSASETEMTQDLSVLTKNMIEICFLFIILTVLFVMYVSKKFVQPFIGLRDEALLLAQGDLRSRPSTVCTDDEVGQLAIAFKQMADNLRSLIIKTQSQAELVSASSEELTASAQQSAEASNQVASSIMQIAQGSGQQLTAMTGMSAIVEAISASIKQVSANVQMIVDIGNQTAHSTANGRQAIEKAIVQMKQIGEGAGAVQYAIGELAKGSNEIISLISSIAEQTNLLAP